MKKSQTDLLSIVQILKNNAIQKPDKVSYSFVDQELNDESFSYAQLFNQVLDNVEILLANGIKKGNRCLLIFEQSIEFIAGFFACQWIGAIPVPLNFPGKFKPLDKWQNIAKECDSRFILTAKNTLKRLVECLSRSEYLNELIVIGIELYQKKKVISKTRLAKDPDLHPIAFLQYTSGSTGNPKGVVVTQKSLVSNLKESHLFMEINEKSTLVSWLPFYHDMGLILMILKVVYSGCSSYIIKPATFMSDPLIWMQAVSKWQGTHTAGPNFAYQLVSDKLESLLQQHEISDSEQTKISLKSLQKCVCGAEPICLNTIHQFQKTVVKFGANNNVIHPGYGLAEATLTVTGKKYSTPLKWLEVDKEALQKNQVSILNRGEMTINDTFPEKKNSLYLVSSGFIIENHEVDIIDIENDFSSEHESIEQFKKLSPFSIGELWFSGPSVTDGYYQNKQATQKGYFYSQSNDTTYLKTGDLAFKDDEGQIYITGRIKDLIIIRGLNYYPHDIERSSFSCHTDFRIDGAAAFSMTLDDSESCVVVQELTRKAVRSPKFEEWSKAIRVEMMKSHEIIVEKILFVSPMRIPRTTSGKIQRKLAKLMTEQQSWGKSLLHVSSLKKKSNSKRKISISNNEATKNVDQIIQDLKHFLDKRVDSYTIDERRCIPPYILSEFGRMGLMGMLIQPQHGGMGLKYSQSIKIVEFLCSVDLTLGLIVSLHNFLGLYPIDQFLKGEVKNDIVAELSAGRETASFALSESGAGSNPNAINTKAKRTHKGNWLLNGEKCWVGSSSWAGWLTVIAHSHDETGKYLGLTAFLIKQGSSGLEHVEEAMTMGMRGTVQGHFTMNDVEVSNEYILGDVGKGVEVIQKVMSMGRITINSACIGILKTVLARAKKWSENRKVNSGYLIDQPIVIKNISELLSVLEIVQNYQTKFSKWLDQELEIPEILATVGKIFSTEESWKAVDFLMQLTAARGYCEHNGIAQLFRDSRVLRIFEGPTESLIADLGSRSDNDFNKVVSFLKRNKAEKKIKVDFEEIKELKKSIYSLSNNVDIDNNYGLASKTKKYHQYIFGELLVYQLIFLICEDDISMVSREWLKKKINNVLEEAKSFNTDLLEKKRFLKSFENVLANHEVIYSQPEYENHGKVSPFRDLKNRESGRTNYNKLTSNFKEDNTNEKTKQKFNQSFFLAKNYQEYENTEKNDNSKKITKRKELNLWIKKWLKSKNVLTENEFSEGISFAEYGLDSSLSILFVNDINNHYNIEIEPSILWSYSTVSDLTEYLCDHEIKIEEDIDSEQDNLSINKENTTNDNFLKQLVSSELS